MSRYLISAVLLLSLGTIKTAVIGDFIDSSAYPEGLITDEASMLNDSAIGDNKTVEVTVTAYSSREIETDETPFLTAAGTKVRTGVVAANWLPLGAKVRIPGIFGDQVFTVEDRMASKNRYKLDIWFPNTEDALRFGVRTTRIEIL